MKLLSVNVGRAQQIRHGKPSGLSGIFKSPSREPVMIGPLGLEGDEIVDTKHHGGPDQAVYVFTAPDYDWWSSHIGRALAPGTFGENLTISALESSALNVGDRLRAGEALLEVTAPRIPCINLAARMNDPHFAERFRHAERPGMYCRVIETGYVKAGDSVELIPYQGDLVNVVEVFRAFYHKELNESQLRRLLSVPIPARARLRFSR
jgi:MOSC domain-containing protein YiiM